LEGVDVKQAMADADLIFIPHYSSEVLLQLPHLNFVLNTFSFQEMSEENIHYYGEIIQQKLSGFIYSDNFRRHPHNYSLKSRVGDILRKSVNIFPRSEDSYDNLERTVNYMWQTYIHFGSNKDKPLEESLDYKSYFIWGENYKLNVNDESVTF
jgi:hypothetical protein